MKKYTIEVDEIIMKYLQKHAEPFVDTPNSVLHKLLIGNSVKVNVDPSYKSSKASFIASKTAFCEADGSFTSNSYSFHNSSDLNWHTCTFLPLPLFVDNCCSFSGNHLELLFVSWFIIGILELDYSFPVMIIYDWTIFINEIGIMVPE